MRGKLTTIGLATIISLLISTSSNVFAVSGQSYTIPVINGFSAKVFEQGTKSVTSQDDITAMNGNIFIGNQNGVGSDGAAASTGATQSTIQEYDHKGNLITSWKITGKCDGLAADVANNRLIATVNEDGNSSMYIITPSKSKQEQIQKITFKAAPGQILPAGGTDSITFQKGNIYISASAPKADSKGNFTTAALFQAVINTDNTATLTPVIMDNATAKDATPGAAVGAKVDLNMSDPDSNNIVPVESPKYGGQVVLVDQGDSKLIFTSKIGTANQISTCLPIGNQIDDIAWATSTKGTLYVTDSSDNKVYEITGKFTKGTAFVSAPNDSGVGGFVGTIDLTTGLITPVAIGMKSPHGLLFVPQTDSLNVNSKREYNDIKVKLAGLVKAGTITKNQEDVIVKFAKTEIVKIATAKQYKESIKAKLISLVKVGTITKTQEDAIVMLTKTEIVKIENTKPNKLMIKTKLNNLVTAGAITKDQKNDIFKLAKIGFESLFTMGYVTKS